jgi:hypothetical protein
MEDAPAERHALELRGVDELVGMHLIPQAKLLPNIRLECKNKILSFL